MVRSAIIMAALLFAALPGRTQTYYVFYNATYGYIYRNGNNPGVTTTFTKDAIWSASGTLPTTGNNTGVTITSYTDNTKKMNGTTSAFTLTNGGTSYWQNRTYLAHRTTSSYYVKWNNGFTCATGTGNRFTPYVVTINNQAAVNPTISITAAAGLSGGGIQLTGNITGTYTPEYSYAAVRRYNQNATTTYYWTSNTEASTSVPTGISSWGDATRTWAVTTGGAYASVNSDGLVTITGNPTGNIVVTLTVTKGGYSGTQTFTLTRAAIAQNVSSETTLSTPSISPSSAALYYNEGSQTFTASATASNTTTTIPAHTTFTGSGNTYYYYNGTLYTSTDDFKSTETTHPAVTLNWALSGAAASNLTRTPASGTSTTVTHSTQSPSDQTATLTVTASATGATNKTATATITAYGPMVAPTITRNGNTISLATTSTGATIYYTTDGTTPSASSTPYTGAFSLTTSPTTVKAIAIRDGHNSTVATETFQIQLAAPAISISNTGLATITAEAGATIHYTTDGTIPTASSPTYTAPVQLTNPQIIMAIATRTNYLTSEATMADYISGGVSGGNVILNDREDHSWTFYSDPDCPIHSLNPADVKITYNGNGTGTVQTNNSDTPSTWGANATTVKVGIDADASTFIYYETLERTDGRTAASAAAATGRCAYTTIANPFSVRPTYSSDATSVYRGFYAWRVKSLSGGTIHSAATGGTSYGVGSTINAETEIYFAPSSEYGMEVEFEALWARAYVSTSAAPSNNLGVERNFYVITASATSNITAGSYPCTYTSIYPNGTTDGTTAATSVTVYKYGGFTASADSKIEYIILRNNSSTVNANGKNFTIGRGVSGYNGGLCATNLYGLNAAATTSFHFNFASGSFTNLYFCGDGNSMSSGVLTSVIGCDYDRAMGDNDNLEITDDIIAGHNGTGGSNNNEGADFLRCTVKSGDFDLGDYGGGVQFYLSLWGNSGSGTYGKKTMVVEGGIFSDISGGIDVQDDQVSAADMVEIRVKGGTVNGALYGAAQYAAAYGNRYIIITGGTMKGWVAGGANGTQTTGGKLTGDTYVYFGGRARCDSEGSNTTMGSGNATGGNIFGAGSGNSGAASTATVGEVNNSTVVIADECYVERNVYGGGNYGSVSTGTGHKSDIYIKGGTIDGSVFGGSNNQKGQIVNINMTDGQVNTGIYGGSNTEGTVAGPVALQIDGGTVGDGGSGDGIFGGGYGSSTIVTGNVSVTLGASTSAADSATVNGNVYGGSALGRTNNGSTTNTTAVTMNKALVNGNVFGGAYGNGAVVNGKITVNVNGGRVNGNIFGGGDAAAYSPNSNHPIVNMTGGQATHVFGGGKGNTATVTGNPQVTLSGNAHVTGNVYGGGDAAQVSGQTNVILRD